MDVFAASPDSRPIEARHEALYRRARNEIPMGRPHARSEQRGGCRGWRMEEGWGLKRKYRALGGRINIVIVEVNGIPEIHRRWVALLSV